MGAQNNPNTPLGVETSNSQKHTYVLVQTSAGNHLVAIFDKKDDGTNGNIAVTIGGADGTSDKYIQQTALNSGTFPNLGYNWSNSNTDGFIMGPYDPNTPTEVCYTFTTINGLGQGSRFAYIGTPPSTPAYVSTGTSAELVNKPLCFNF